MTNGQPAHETETVLTWMYYKAFSAGEFGYAAGLSFIIALCLAVLAALQFYLMKRRSNV
jgi:multiple sugar transport system permease protein